MLYGGFPHILVCDSVFVGDAKDLSDTSILNSSDWILRCSSAVSVLVSHAIKKYCYDQGAHYFYFVFYSDVLVFQTKCFLSGKCCHCWSSSGEHFSSGTLITDYGAEVYKVYYIFKTSAPVS